MSATHKNYDDPTWNFWLALPRPAFSLAPMEDVTDTAFRQLVLETAEPGALHVVFTEFCSTDGLCHAVGRDKVRHRLWIPAEERALLREKNVRIVAQVWGSDPDKFAAAIREMVNGQGFDGIDINMGCPVPKIVKQGGCSALIDDPGRAAEIIAAAKEASELPVSVKTRTGGRQHDIERWLGAVFASRPAAVILHGRTRHQMSEGQADWSQIGAAAALRERLGLAIPVHGNGDVQSLADGTARCAQHHLDGAMIGRGIFGNPWLFAPSRSGEAAPDKEEKLLLLWRHVSLYKAHWGEDKNFRTLRRFFKIYAQGFDGASQLRGAFNDVENMAGVRLLLLQAGISPEALDRTEAQALCFHGEAPYGSVRAKVSFPIGIRS